MRVRQDVGQRLSPDHRPAPSRSSAPDDLKGFKIRVPVSPLWTSMFKALDAAPTAINFSEVYSGAADQDRRRAGEPAGRSSTPPSSTRCRSTARSPTTCGTASGCWPTGAPGSSCPADLRAIVARSFNEAARRAARGHRQAERRRCKAELKAKGLVFNTADPTAFREELQRPASTRSGRASSATRPGRSWRSTSGKLA